jgi:hypothetical protein
MLEKIIKDLQTVKWKLLWANSRGEIVLTAEISLLTSAIDSLTNDFVVAEVDPEEEWSGEAPKKVLKPKGKSNGWKKLQKKLK